MQLTVDILIIVYETGLNDEKKIYYDHRHASCRCYVIFQIAPF